MFRLARSLGRTVRELYTGERGPLDANEYTGWVAFMVMEQADQQRAGKKRRGR